MEANSNFISGTLGGTVLSVLPHLTSADVYRTVVLAIVGAFVSFIVSVILKMLFRSDDQD